MIEDMRLESSCDLNKSVFDVRVQAVKQREVFCAVLLEEIFDPRFLFKQLLLAFYEHLSAVF